MKTFVQVFGSIIGCLSIIVVIAMVLGCATRRHAVSPDCGFVPDKETAIRIAETVLVPIYGQQQTESERPFAAHLRKGKWIVEGFLPEGVAGGVAIVEISKKNGAILRVSHGK